MDVMRLVGGITMGRDTEPEQATGCSTSSWRPQTLIGLTASRYGAAASRLGVLQLGRAAATAIATCGSNGFSPFASAPASRARSPG